MSPKLRAQLRRHKAKGYSRSQGFTFWRGGKPLVHWGRPKPKLTKALIDDVMMSFIAKPLV